MLAAHGAGFPNIARPTAGALLTPSRVAATDGRTAVIAWHNGLVYTAPESPGSAPGSDIQARVWDFANPASPQVMEVLGTSHQPVNAHDYFYRNNQLIIGNNFPVPMSFDATATYGVNTRGPFAEMHPQRGVGSRGTMFHPFIVMPTYWIYNNYVADAYIHRRNMQTSVWENFATWDHLGLTGVIGHPIIVGNLLFMASDQSRTGLAIYDISNLNAPVLLCTLTDGGPGGYWPSMWGGGGRLYVVWPYRRDFNDGHMGFRMVDVTDPTDPQWIIDKELPDEDETMYIMFQDDYAFMGNHKVDLRSKEVVLSLATEANGMDASQFALPLGNLVIAGGYGTQQGMSVWVHQTTADTRPPEVGYHIPRDGQTNYPVTSPISLLIHETLETRSIVNGDTILIRPVGGAALPAQFARTFDGIITGNNPTFRNTFWATARAENVTLLAGANNNIEISRTGGDWDIDNFTVSTPNDLVLAQPHRSVPAAQRADLLAYLRSLDGSAVVVDAANAPSVGITPQAGQGNPVRWPFVEFDIAFSAAVNDFTNSDLIIEGSASATWVTLIPSGDDIHYRARLGGFTGNGNVSVRLNIGAASASRAVLPVSVDWLNPVPVVDPLASTGDEFSDATTLTAWQRLDQTEGWGANKLTTHTISSGRMTLIPSASGMYQDYLGPYVFRTVTGDFIATVQMDVSRRNAAAGRPSSNFSIGGLVLRRPKTITNAGASPGSDWIAGAENSISFNFGTADPVAQTNANQWQASPTRPTAPAPFTPAHSAFRWGKTPSPCSSSASAAPSCCCVSIPAARGSWSSATPAPTSLRRCRSASLPPRTSMPSPDSPPSITTAPSPLAAHPMSSWMPSGSASPRHQHRSPRPCSTPCPSLANSAPCSCFPIPLPVANSAHHPPPSQWLSMVKVTLHGLL